MLKPISDYKSKCIIQENLIKKLKQFEQLYSDI